MVRSRRHVVYPRSFLHQGVKARDLLHVAADAQRIAVAEIVSTDRHFDHIGEITRLDPQVRF